jgi:hypothetical protein
MKSYFDNRFAKLWHQNTEVTKRLTRGCPQGSACGPGFWNIIYDSCLKINFEENIELQGFADDSLLMEFDMSINNLKRKSELALEKLSEWAKQNKLEFNPIKTTAVIFTRNIKFDKPAIKFQNHELILANSFKYLGIHVDSKLNWKVHINESPTTGYVTNELC